MTKPQQNIGILILFSVTTLLLRAQLTQSLFFGFLLWNIFLASIPYFISEWMKKIQLTKTKIVFYSSIWLLFLPNAPYIITDFIHLHHPKSTLIWYDLFMLFSFAFTGLLLAIISMYDIYSIVKKYWSLTIANRFITVTTFLCGYGIYLGRFLRLNSWNIFTSPLQTLKQSIISYTDETTWFITIGFGLFLSLLFSTYKTLITKNIND